jgi:hypothetical protein
MDEISKVKVQWDRVTASSMNRFHLADSAEFLETGLGDTLLQKVPSPQSPFSIGAMTDGLCRNSEGCA